MSICYHRRWASPGFAHLWLWDLAEQKFGDANQSNLQEQSHTGCPRAGGQPGTMPWSGPLGQAASRAGDPAGAGEWRRAGGRPVSTGVTSSPAGEDLRGLRIPAVWQHGRAGLGRGGVCRRPSAGEAVWRRGERAAGGAAVWRRASGRAAVWRRGQEAWGRETATRLEQRSSFW